MTEADVGGGEERLHCIPFVIYLIVLLKFKTNFSFKCNIHSENCKEPSSTAPSSSVCQQPYLEIEHTTTSTAPPMPGSFFAAGALQSLSAPAIMTVHSC